MNPAALETSTEPVWARDTAFPESPPGWGWVDSKDKRHPCASLQEVIDAVIADHGGSICLVWTPENPRMVLPEEVTGLYDAINRSRAAWTRTDLEDYTSRLRRFLIFFGALFLWVFYRQSTLFGGGTFASPDRILFALKRTLNDSTIEVGFLLLVIFVIIPWYQARKRSTELTKFSTPAGLREVIPTLRFEIWLDRQKAPFTWLFLGLMALVGIAQFLPGDAITAAGLVKSAYRENGDWWRLFTAPFLHGHPIHFAMNAAALVYLGKRLEVFARWPHLPLVFIFSAVIGGQASTYFLRDATTVGASGGLMGWLGFLIVFETLHARLVPRSARRRLAAAVLLTAAIGILGHRFIDNAAHGGGLLAGMLYAAIVFPKSSSVYRPQSTLTDRVAGIFALAICIASALLALWKIAGA